MLAVGPQPSVIRAGVAGALASLAWLTGRQRDRWYALLVAAIVLLAWNPYTLLDPGFQLSFAAVVSIFVLAPRFAGALEGYPVPRGSRDCDRDLGRVRARDGADLVAPLPRDPAAHRARERRRRAGRRADARRSRSLAALLPPAAAAARAGSTAGARRTSPAARAFFGGLPGAAGPLGRRGSPRSARACSSPPPMLGGVAERAEAGLPPHRQRPAEDRARASHGCATRIGDDATEHLNAREATGADAVAACNALGLFVGEGGS